MGPPQNLRRVAGARFAQEGEVVTGRCAIEGECGDVPLVWLAQKLKAAGEGVLAGVRDGVIGEAEAILLAELVEQALTLCGPGRPGRGILRDAREAARMPRILAVDHPHRARFADETRAIERADHAR